MAVLGTPTYSLANLEHSVLGVITTARLEDLRSVGNYGGPDRGNLPADPVPAERDGVEAHCPLGRLDQHLHHRRPRQPSHHPAVLTGGGPLGD